MTFWEIIVESNSFNFAILLLIFAILYKKFNVSELINKIRQEIISTIEHAKSEQNLASIKLKSAKDNIQNLNKEIQIIKNNSETHAKNITDNIVKTSNKQIANIRNNTNRTINATEKIFESKAISKTMQLSVDIARHQIEDLLVNNPKLHETFIEESLKEI